jgi:DNA-binding CsgD family transcriptional regulator
MSAAQNLPEAARFLGAVVAPADLSPRAHQNFLTAYLNASMCSGDLAGWLKYAKQMRTLLPSLSPFLQILALYIIAQTGSYLGASEESALAVNEADQLNKKWEFGGLAAFGAAVATVHYWLRGELSDARRCVDLVLERPDVTVAQTNLAHIGPLVAIALGELALGARCHPPHIVAAARECEIPGDTALLLGVHSTWLAAGGRLEEARADLQTALDVMPHATASSVIVFAAAARWLPVSELDRIERLSTQGLEAASGRVPAANAAFIAAIVAQRRGLPQAISLANGTADCYHRIGWPLFEAQALEIGGRHEEAQAIFERCGALGFMPKRRKIAAAVVASSVTLSRHGLSAREYEVAHLVTLGSTNALIADRLGVSTKTVEKHLSSIFAKLDVKSRAEIAAYIARAGPGSTG